MFRKLFPVPPEGQTMALIVVGTVSNSEEPDMNATVTVGDPSRFLRGWWWWGGGGVGIFLSALPCAHRACAFTSRWLLIIWTAESLIWLLHFLCEQGPLLEYRAPLLYPQPYGTGGHVCVRSRVGALRDTQCSRTLFCRQLLKTFPPWREGEFMSYWARLCA